eukprot:g4604.t1
MFLKSTRDAISRVIAQCGRLDGALRVFKESHMFIKRVLLEIDPAHEHQINDDWLLTHERVRAMPEHRQRELLNSLRALVISFDAIPARKREELTTADEIIRNRTWLIKARSTRQLVLVDDAHGGKAMKKAQRARLAREEAQRQAAVKVELDAQRKAREELEAERAAADDSAVRVLLSGSGGGGRGGHAPGRSGGKPARPHRAPRSGARGGGF